MSLGKNQFYQFGSFRLDPAKRLLLRGQRPVSLLPKAFDTLIVLVENRDRMVSKEELLKTLWPDSFVEEANIAQNVAVLRKALGDSPEQHRYILTIPGRGYRFAAMVSEQTESEEPDVVVERHSRSRVVVQESAAREGSAAITASIARLLKRPWGWALAGALVGVVLLFVFWKPSFHAAPVLGETDSILVSDFVNTTGDPIFDGTLRQALALKLGESPSFNLLDDAKVRETLKLMGRSPEDRVVSPVAREACQRAGAKVVVGGSIISVGNRYVLDLDATDCFSGSSLAHQEAQAQSRDQVLIGLGQMILPLRRKLGESLSTIQKFDTPIEQATTKSLAALKAYTLGDEKRAQGKEADSVPHYKMAIEFDPDFAMAYARLGTVYGNLNQADLSGEYLQKAFERREHVSEREKLYIQAHYYEDATREADKAIETYDLWTQTYPRDFLPFNSLSSQYITMGEPEKAIKAGQQALRLNPNHALGYASLSRAYERATRFAEAKAICERAIVEKIDSSWTHQVLYRMAFVEGDEPAMQREIDWFQGKPQESANSYYRAKAALSLGQLRRSRELFERARSLALGQGFKEQAIAIINGQAQFEAELGNDREARTLAQLSLRTMPASSRHNAFAALALARAGDTHGAEAVLSGLAKQPSLDTALNEVVLPAIRAAIDLDRKNPAGAVQELQHAIPYDLGTDSSGATVYYRGLAYLKLKAGKEAAAQFQTILDNRGVATTDVYWPLAHLGIARAYAMTGETDKSLAHYREFLALWKSADRGLRVRQEANAEYKKLGETLRSGP